MNLFTKSQVKRIFSQLGHDPEVISCNKDYILVRFYLDLTLSQLEEMKRVFKGKEVEIGHWDFDGIDLIIILKE